MPAPDRTAEALTALDEITRRLRRECPWDREQDERSIVPHTVEEAYELADAAQSGDDAKLVDELGDVLFQVYFLSLLLEEREAGSLAEVADRCREKLVRRHPHVFGDTAVDTAAGVVRQWDEIKREDERGGALFGSLPDTLPSLSYARKVQRQAGEGRTPFQIVGELFFQAVAAARALDVDPELALRDAANRFKEENEA
ncbi:MAG TPA: MazG nucleotide pyrophosphohydrolase domain-containing protein [Thermoleophilaceae bacterium]|nr:MazG nucleotide pyrophosphohydrolase domain-containing protein [Thermoleophilaceae bacterium]